MRLFFGCVASLTRLNKWANTKLMKRQKLCQHFNPLFKSLISDLTTAKSSAFEFQFASNLDVSIIFSLSHFDSVSVSRPFFLFDGSIICIVESTVNRKIMYGCILSIRCTLNNARTSRKCMINSCSLLFFVSALLYV